jgi:hypothetical protein
MAQFVVVPPLDRVGSLFCIVTGCHFVPEVSWISWKICDVSDITWLHEYIRPSHHKLLNDTLLGIQPNPCSLLRQILRPHKYHIEKTSYGWTLKEGKSREGPKLVAVKPGRRIVWNDDDDE